MILKYLLARGREASTWRGVTLLLTAAGVALTPGQAEAVIAAGLALAGLIGTLVPDAKTGGPSE